MPGNKVRSNTYHGNIENTIAHAQLGADSGNFLSRELFI